MTDTFRTLADAGSGAGGACRAGSGMAPLRNTALGEYGAPSAAHRRGPPEADASCANML